MIEREDLLNILKIILNKDNIILEDLDKIEDLTLNKYKLNNSPNDIDLKELNLFKNLKTLTLINFNIRSKDIEAINKNKNLWAVQFSKCIFEDAIPINTGVKYLIIDYCKEIKYELINNNRTTRIIGATVDLDLIKQTNQIERLFLQNCDIKNERTLLNYTQLKYLNIDGSRINSDILNNLDKNIQISYKTEYHPEEG